MCFVEALGCMAMESPRLTDPKLCPLCTRPNECGMAAQRETCWCFSVKVDPAALEKIPAEAKGKACVCQACGVAVPKVESSGSNR